MSGMGLEEGVGRGMGAGGGGGGAGKGAICSFAIVFLADSMQSTAVNRAGSVCLG